MTTLEYVLLQTALMQTLRFIMDNGRVRTITTKQQRDEAVQSECSDNSPGILLEDMNYRVGYRAGANSLANLEWIVRRVYQALDDRGDSMHFLTNERYLGSKDLICEDSIEDTITTLAKELGIEDEGK